LGRSIRIRSSQPAAHSLGMDLIALAIGLLFFVAMALLIEGLGRV
jgi:hypothetical protein